VPNQAARSGSKGLTPPEFDQAVPESKTRWASRVVNMYDNLWACSDGLTGVAVERRSKYEILHFKHSIYHVSISGNCALVAMATGMS